MMTEEKWKPLREQILSDGIKLNTDCLYDANELSLMIHDYHLSLVEVRRELSETKTKLERAKEIIAYVQSMGQVTLFQAIQTINKDTHREKDNELKGVLLSLRYLIEKASESLDKPDPSEF